MKGEAEKIISKAREEDRGFLLEPEAKRLCALYGLPVTRFEVAKSEDEAVEAARRIGFPIVLKVISPQVLHKSDVGGVILNLRDEEGVREAYRRIHENVKAKVPGAVIEGIIVQEMAPSSTEVIVGAIKDPTFGPTIMFGLGGIFVEILRDVSFRLVPIERVDAEEMIGEIKAYKILEGARGMPKADKEALIEILL
ncbi:acetyl-CoA synthetase, partial [Candidatus Bathyarchaeota archaeon]